MERYFINAPSTFSLLHELHGTRVLAEREKDNKDFFKVYFLEGNVVSSRIPKGCLSKGWKI